MRRKIIEKEYTTERMSVHLLELSKYTKRSPNWYMPASITMEAIFSEFFIPASKRLNKIFLYRSSGKPSDTGECFKLSSNIILKRFISSSSKLASIEGMWFNSLRRHLIAWFQDKWLQAEYSIHVSFRLLTYPMRLASPIAATCFGR